MKDRDVSVILNNVTINDTGTYECRVRNSSTKPPQLLNTTRLTVTTLDQQQNTVKTGDNVTLQCLDHRGGDIELLEWRRQNLKEAAFVWKHGKMSDDNQHPSFKNRVELRDPEMKDGDVSVILKNVTIKDTGTYECYVRNSNTKPPQLLNTTKLTVTALDQQQITVKTGNYVTLQCLDPSGGEIKLLLWSRQDLKEDVFVWRHGQMFEAPQHPSFKNRVELRDPEMKDGDVSVILKNVTINDTGTYECRVRNNKTKPPPHLITTINLTVVNSGADEHGGDKHRHLKLVPIVFFVSVILVIVGIVCVILRKCNCHFSS
ncbi:V-set domain containing T-cell activation inhibitor 1-like isoform X2 [Channa argus]